MNGSLRRFSVGCLGSLGLLAVACGDASESAEAEEGEGGSSGAETATTTSIGAGPGEPVTSTGAGTTTSVTTGAGGAGGGACDTGELVTGEAFAQLSGLEGGPIDHVAATPDVVVAASAQALHRSTDGGLTWSIVDADALRGTFIQSVVARGDEIFVGLWDGALRSRDGGLTWDDVSGPDAVAPGYMSVRGDALYATWLGRPLRWDAETEQWAALPVGEHTFFDVIESDGQAIYANAIYEPGVFRLDLGALEPGDGGAPVDEAHGPWVKVEGLSEWGYRAFAFQEGVGFASNLERVFQSTDAGETWEVVAIDDVVNVADFLAVGGALYAATDVGLFARQGDGAWTSTTSAHSPRATCSRRTARTSSPPPTACTARSLRAPRGRSCRCAPTACPAWSPRAGRSSSAPAPACTARPTRARRGRTCPCRKGRPSPTPAPSRAATS